MNVTIQPNTVRPIPENYHTVTPWIASKDTAGLLEFIKKAFGAVELGRVYNADGTIGHAEARIGDSVVMMFDWEEYETPCFLRLYVEDCDAVYHQALSAGATSITEMTDLYFGDRIGRVRDPMGNIWWIQTHREDVSMEEMEKRAGEKQYAEDMQYVQQSFVREMRNRGHR